MLIHTKQFYPTKEIHAVSAKSINSTWSPCASRTKIIQTYRNEIVCVHKDNKHILGYIPDSLKNLCVKHYANRYIKEDRTDLTSIPNWRFLILRNNCHTKYSEELELAMLMCKPVIHLMK